jgi:ribosomal protein L40E
MIICTQCGNAAPSRDGFCSSCGALLEWAGEKLPERPGPAGQSNGNAGSGEAAAQGGLARPPAPEPDRPDPLALAVEPEYSGSYCWSCGARNPEARVFCRSCGARIAPDAAPEQRLSWWRRLMRRLRGRRNRAAGERPSGFRRHEARTTATASASASGGAQGKDAKGYGGSDSAFAKPKRSFKVKPPRRLPISRIAPLLVVLGLVGVGIGPARQWVTTKVFGVAQSAQNRLHEQYVPDAAVSASASSAVAGHAANLVIDGVNTTFWAADDANSGVGDTLTVQFGNPVDLARIGVLSGEPGAGYLTQPRPKTVTISAAGDPPVQLTFVDTANFQDFSVNLANVTTLTITFTAVYPGQQGHDMAVRDFEFFSLQQ